MGYAPTNPTMHPYVKPATRNHGRPRLRHYWKRFQGLLDRPGFAFDLSHSYTVPILASTGANIAAVIVATMSHRRPRKTIAAA